jgi:hypothetical protein
MQHQFSFTTSEQFVNWRRQWRRNYAEIANKTKALKVISRDLTISEQARQTAGKQLNTQRQLARTLMMGLDAAKMFYEMTNKRKAPIVYKQRPSDEEIVRRQVAKAASKSQLN